MLASVSYRFYHSQQQECNPPQTKQNKIKKKKKPTDGKQGGSEREKGKKKRMGKEQGKERKGNLFKSGLTKASFLWSC